MKLAGTIVDLVKNEQFTGELEIKSGRIAAITRSDAVRGPFILPGFVDAHIHIESSMLPPSEFARLAVVHGTVATVSDPHEIANVLGVDGVKWMIENGRTVPFKFSFGAPSCVPATIFETAGATINPTQVAELLAMPEIRYLSEMMNFPGVLNGDETVHQKLEAAKLAGKVIDGHAPGLRGADAARYASFGISTDHECFTTEEALDKLNAGMSIIIREGSAAKNFDALIDLLRDFPERIMFCSDDKHPNDLTEGHINQLVKRALARGLPLYDVLRAASVNPVRHYGLPVGLLQPGDSADFVVVDDLENMNVLEVYIDGQCVASHGKSLLPHLPTAAVNNFSCKSVMASDFRLNAGASSMRVIEALDGQLITNEKIMPTRSSAAGEALSDPSRDVLKLIVLNRYMQAKPTVAFVTNFGLLEGALASSVAHDSHNIVAVGANDEDLASAVNLIIQSQGGVSLAAGNTKMIVPLPIAGLMSTAEGYSVAEDYRALDAKAKELGCKLPSPFMTLSFLALLVIPKLKLSDLGLFDGEKFQFTNLFLN